VDAEGALRSRARLAQGFLLPLLFCAAALLALAAAIRLATPDVGPALAALVRGAFGSVDAIASATLVRAIPLILTGLAVSLAFRAGVWNIGADGQLLAGAIAATGVALHLPQRLGPFVPVAALALGAAAGAGWAGIAAVMKRYLGVLEVISTIMLNFVALHAVSYLVRGPLQEHQHLYPQSEPIPDWARLARLISSSRLHWGLVLAIAAAVGTWWLLANSATGFRLSLVGANPAAARLAGRVDVEQTVFDAFLVSGALAGVAGAVEVTGVTFALYENLSPGYGYTAIAIALLARLRPIPVILVAIALGGLEAGALAMQREAGVPSGVSSIVEGTLLLLAIAVGSSRLAAAAGPALFRRSTKNT